jgi:hypothetical protein
MIDCLAMTITLCIRLPDWPAVANPAPAPAPAAPAGAPASGDTQAAATLRLLRMLLPLVEPTALLATELAGLGCIGKLLVSVAITSARRALGA